MTGPRYQDLAGDAVPVGRQPGVVVRAFFEASFRRQRRVVGGAVRRADPPTPYPTGEMCRTIRDFAAG